MPEVRAATLAIYAEEENGNPLLVIRNENGVLRAITKVTRFSGSVVRGNQACYEDILVLEPERD
jgi:hypothetical protein